jgi:hypothetical protein
MNALSLAWSFVVAPAQASRQLRDKPVFLLPVLLIVLASAGLMLWYYTGVDLDWLKDYLFTGNARIQALSEADRARVMATVSRTTLTLSAVAGVIVIELAGFLLQGLYFLVAGRATGVRNDFRHWFALACWTSLPTLVGIVYGGVLLATSGQNFQVSPGALQPLSLNELFFHRLPNEPGYSLLSSLTLLNLWVWVLGVIGVRTWSGRTWMFSSLFVMLPMVVVYGVWTALALRPAG